MLGLFSLPIELWLQIIENLKDDETGAPITGVNAGWTKLANVCQVPPQVPHGIEPWYTASKARSGQVHTSSALSNFRA